ncbi:hypothetical protein GCM10027275_08060 [Rhabdobacter roseus]
MNTNDDLPQKVTVEHESSWDQFQLIQQLDEDDKIVVFKIIDTMLIKKKFKDFFLINMAAL